MSPAAADWAGVFHRPRRRRLAAFAALGVILATIVAIDALAVFTDATPVSANALGTDTLESPTGLVADASTPGQVELTWTATTDTYADGYDIYSSDTPGTGYTLIGSVTGSATVTYTDTDPGQPGCTNNAGFVAYESDVNNFSTTSATVNVPAATTIDDVLIAHIAVEGNNPGYSTPTGWTLIATNNPGDGSGQAVYYRIADGTEPSSYTFTWSDNQDSIATISTYTGIDTTTPINVSATSEGSSDDPIAPSVTTTATDTIVMRLVSNNHDHTTTAPAGVTTRFNLVVDEVVSVGGDSTQSGAGATGTAVFDDGGAHDWAASTIALTQKPACTPQYYVVQATAQNWNSPNSNEATAGSVTSQVSASSDDAEEFLDFNDMYLNSTDLELAREDASDAQIVGMRFNSISVPAGATIVNAWIQYQVDETTSETTNLTLQAQDIDNAPTFTTATSNISARTKTSASVAWSPPAWTVVGATGADQQTPDLSNIIQEVVDRAGWVNGNSIVITVSGTGQRIAEAYDEQPSAAPTLHIHYSS